jgi:hypothetical protein
LFPHFFNIKNYGNFLINKIIQIYTRKIDSFLNFFVKNRKFSPEKKKHWTGSPCSGRTRLYRNLAHTTSLSSTGIKNQLQT